MIQNKRRLGVNIDHIATLREARKVTYPAPLESLAILKDCQVSQVTIHLREDRRHIQDDDVVKIIQANLLPVNLEMAVTDEMIDIASRLKPHTVTFVPEKRQEITTEGGLNCILQKIALQQAIAKLKERGIRCSLFIDPDLEQVKISQEVKADGVEFHTGTYCNVLEELYIQEGHYHFEKHPQYSQRANIELSKLNEATSLAVKLGLKAFAGHGLHKENLKPVTQIQAIEEYNIGHAIIARALFVGLKKAIREIQEILC